MAVKPQVSIAAQPNVIDIVRLCLWHDLDVSDMVGNRESGGTTAGICLQIDFPVRRFEDSREPRIDRHGPLKLVLRLFAGPSKALMAGMPPAVNSELNPIAMLVI